VHATKVQVTSSKKTKKTQARAVFIDHDNSTYDQIFQGLYLPKCGRTYQALYAYKINRKHYQENYKKARKAKQFKKTFYKKTPMHQPFFKTKKNDIHASKAHDSKDGTA
jgi:hypothetical protein